MLQPVPKSRPVEETSRPNCVLGQLRDNAVDILVYERVLDRILDYSEQDLTRELGGFLLGGYYLDDSPYVEVRHFLEAVDVRSQAASLTFTHETWSAMKREVADRGLVPHSPASTRLPLRLRSIHSPPFFQGAVANRNGSRPCATGIRVLSVAR